MMDHENKYKDFVSTLLHSYGKPTAKYPGILYTCGIGKAHTILKKTKIPVYCIDEYNCGKVLYISIPNCNWFGINKDDSKWDPLQTIHVLENLFTRGIQSITEEFSYWFNYGEERPWIRVTATSSSYASEMISLLTTKGYNISYPRNINSKYGFSPKAKHYGLEIFRFIKDPGSAEINIEDLVYIKEELPCFAVELSYDIEVQNDSILHNNMVAVPGVETGYICNIGMVYQSGILEPRELVISVTPEGVLFGEKHHVAVHTERDLMFLFVELLIQIKPRFIIGYNVLMFDNKWIFASLARYNLWNKWIKHFPVFQGLEQIMTPEKYVRSCVLFFHSTQGKENGTLLMSWKMDTIDVMDYVIKQKLFDPATGKGLDAVGVHLGLGQKHETNHYEVDLYSKLAFFASDEKYTQLLPEIWKAKENNTLSQQMMESQMFVAWLKKDWAAYLSMFKNLFYEYAEYCLQDAKLTLSIATHCQISMQALELSNFSSIPLKNILYGGLLAIINGARDHYFHSQNYQYHNLTEEAEAQKRVLTQDYKPVGGITLENSVRGIKDKQLGFTIDASNAYAAVARQLKIGADNLQRTPPKSYVQFNLFNGEGNEFAVYCDLQKTCVVGEFLQLLMERRKLVKAKIAQAKKDKKSKFIISTLNAQQQALKFVLVASYGQTGTVIQSFSPFVNVYVTSGITISLASLLVLCMRLVYVLFGMAPHMGVTDSASYDIPSWMPGALGIDTGDIWEDRFQCIKLIEREFEIFFNNIVELVYGKPGLLKFEVETYEFGCVRQVKKQYSKKILDSSKTNFKDAYDNGSQKIVGVSMVRANTSILMHKISRRLIDSLHTIEEVDLTELGFELKRIVQNDLDDFLSIGLRENISPRSPKILKFMAKRLFLVFIDSWPFLLPTWHSRIVLVERESYPKQICLNGNRTNFDVGGRLMTEEEYRGGLYKVCKEKIYDLIYRLIDRTIPEATLLEHFAPVKKDCRGIKTTAAQHRLIIEDLLNKVGIPKEDPCWFYFTNPSTGEKNSPDMLFFNSVKKHLENNYSIGIDIDEYARGCMLVQEKLNRDIRLKWLGAHETLTEILNKIVWEGIDPDEELLKKISKGLRKMISTRNSIINQIGL